MHTPLALRRRFVVVGTVLILLVGGVSVGQVQAQAAANGMLTASTAYSAALSTFETDQSAAAAGLEAARESLRIAQAGLDNSDGKVLDQVARDALASALTEANLNVDSATNTFNSQSAKLDAISSGPRTTTAQFEKATRAMSKHHFTSVTVNVSVQHQAVTDAVLAWQDQARQVAAAQQQQTRQAAAVQEAAVAQQAADVRQAAAAQQAAAGQQSPQRAAAQALAQAAPPVALLAQPARSPKAPVAPAVPQTTWNVWAEGAQAEVDACKGPVDVTAAYQGIPVIAEHWGCGGNNFPRTEGAIVTLTGIHAGSWRIGAVAATLNKQTQTTRDLPWGNDLMYQTCFDGSDTTMTFTVLTRVG